MSPSESAPRGPAAPIASQRGPARDGAAALFLLTALLLAGARFLRLGAWSLWHDEALTLHDLSELGLGQGELPSHPLGVGLVGLWTRLAAGGWPSEFDLRFLPALAGALSVPLCAWVFVPFVGRRRAALTALLVAASSWHLYWSQNARFYTFALVLSLLGGGLYLRGLWRGRFGLLALGLLAWALTPGMHLSGLLVPIGLVVATAVLPWVRIPLPTPAARMRKPLLLGVLLLLVAAVLVALPKWSEYLEKKGTAGWQDPAQLVGGIAHFALTTGWYVTPLLGAGVLAGAVVAFRRRSAFDLLVAVACVAALAAGALASTAAIVSAQYVFCLLPWLAVVATAPLDVLPGSARARANPGSARARASDGQGGDDRERSGPALGYAALLVLPALAGLALYFGKYDGERPRWRDAYRYVWNERGPDDLVLGANSPVGEYYLNPGHTALRTPRRIVRHDGYTSEIPFDWVRHPRRTWLIAQRELFEASTWWPEDRAKTLAMLREQFRMVEAFPLQVGTRDMSVWVYVRD